MKDKRNCGNNMSYPIYQQPMMVPPMGYPMPGTFQGFQGFQPGMATNMASSVSTNTYEQQINNLEQQLNVLDQRVTRLERNINNSSNNNYNKYSDSNYYMV